MKIKALFLVALLVVPQAFAGRWLFEKSQFVNTLSVLNANTKSVSFGTVFQFERTDPFTICAWIKPTTATTGTTEQTIFSNRNSGAGFRGVVFEVIGSGYLFQEVNTGATNYLDVRTANSTVTAATWQLGCVTTDGTGTAAGTKIYSNAVSLSLTIVKNALATTIVSGAAAKIGVDPAGDPFVGNFNNISFWNAALSSSEINSILNAGHPSNLAVLSFYGTKILSWYAFGNGDTTTTFADKASTRTGTGTNYVSGDFVADVP